MRKSLIVIILLFILAAASLGYIHEFVDKDKDTITFKETVLYGDKLAAEGIVVNLNLHCNNHLFWDTTYLVGEEPAVSTDFLFSQIRKTTPATEPPFALYLDSLNNFSASGWIDMADEIAPIQDVAGRTGPGEKREEVVYVKDYYDFYPIQVGFRPFRSAVPDDTKQIFADFLRIPVHPDHKVEIQVEKDAAGRVRGIRLSSLRDIRVHFYALSASTETGCFFTLALSSIGGELLDTSYIPGGYGIYHFPLTDGGKKVPDLTTDDLRTVFPVDADKERIVTLQTTDDKKRLLVLTVTEEAYLLRVIDTATYEQLQELKVLPVSQIADPLLRGFYVYDDLILPMLNNGQFALLALNTEGNYEVRLTGDFHQHAKFSDFIFDQPAIDYDGEKLAVAVLQSGDYGAHNNFYLAVYDSTGLRYAGHYEHSLGKDPMKDYSLLCQPVRGTPLTVTWGG